MDLEFTPAAVHNPLTVKITRLAEGTYASIKVIGGPGNELDVRLDSTGSAERQLRYAADRMEQEANRKLERVALIRRAAKHLEDEQRLNAGMLARDTVINAFARDNTPAPGASGQ